MSENSPQVGSLWGITGKPLETRCFVQHVADGFVSFAILGSTQTTRCWRLSEWHSMVAKLGLVDLTAQPATQVTQGETVRVPYNEPAFPVPMVSCDNQGGMTEVRFQGVTVRDYIAVKAMAALIAKMPLFDREGVYGLPKPQVVDIHQVRIDVSQSAYDYADAMMAQREVLPQVPTVEGVVQPV